MAKVSKSRGRNDGQPPVAPDIDFEKLLAEARQKIPEISWPDNFGDNDPDIKAITDFLRATERGELANLDSPGDSKRKKVAARMPPSLELRRRPQTSEGYIEEFDRSASLGLPENPSRLWQPRKPGRPPASENGRLISFIKEVYGPFMAEHRDELRSYIYHHDRPLYDAIITYERREALPADIAIPDRNDRQLRNLEEAQAAGFPGMTKKQKLDAQAALNRAKQTTKMRPQ